MAFINLSASDWSLGEFSYFAGQAYLPFAKLAIVSASAPCALSCSISVSLIISAERSIASSTRRLSNPKANLNNLSVLSCTCFAVLLMTPVNKAPNVVAILPVPVAISVVIPPNDFPSVFAAEFPAVTRF